MLQPCYYTKCHGMFINKRTFYGKCLAKRLSLVNNKAVINNKTYHVENNFICVIANTFEYVYINYRKLIVMARNELL